MKNKLYDFSDCIVDEYETYDGANGGKKAIWFNEKLYMLKLSPIKDGKRTNASISEDIGCKISKSLGLKTQNTILGTYNGEIVVICEDFTFPNKKLHNFTSIKNSVLNSSKSGKGLMLSEILDTIKNQNYIDPNELKTFFWDMFILDALIANGDRHNGNWGILSSRILKTKEIAPIFDCGSSFHCKFTESEMQEVLDDNVLLNNLVTGNPRSAIFIKNRGINYYNYLTTTDNEDCIKSLKKIVPRINLQIINQIIEDTPYISDIHKKYLKLIVKERKEKILDRALDINPNINNDREKSNVDIF